MKTNFKEIYFSLFKEKFPKKLEEAKLKLKLEHLDSTINVV